MISSQKQKVVEKEAETERKKAVIGNYNILIQSSCQLSNCISLWYRGRESCRGGKDSV